MKFKKDMLKQMPLYFSCQHNDRARFHLMRQGFAACRLDGLTVLQLTSKNNVVIIQSIHEIFVTAEGQPKFWKFTTV